MGSLLDKISKNSTIKASNVLSESKFFGRGTSTQTNLPVLNIALSGNLDGGLTSGLTQICGPTKHFKTNLGLACVAAYLNKHPESVCIYYDSEFGSPPEYLEQFGIDVNRVLHVPLLNIEELKFDMSRQLEEIEPGDKVIFFIDSIGNLASKKEVDDALSGSSKADMTRAKQLKSVFRICTPYFRMKDIPCIAINHVYKTNDMFPQDVVSGGTGISLSSSTIIIVGRTKEKDGRDVIGYQFKMKIEKSRYAKEHSILPFIAKFETGIDRWSGLLDIAIELGWVVKPKNGKYSRVLNDENGEILDDKEWKRDGTSCNEFWGPLLSNDEFKTAVKKRYSLGTVKMLNVNEDETNE